MTEAFIIMQIGDADLDRVCDDALIPAIRDSGLTPRRVDRDNEGTLLKSEIVKFINEAEIIVADLTNERPNVYLEVGYAMGVDKFRNLILTCRADHLPGNDGWSPEGPRVHFDLSGYDILFWDPEDLPGLRNSLRERIQRRRARIRPTERTAPAPLVDEEWVEEQRQAAKEDLDQLSFGTTMEIAFALRPPKPNLEQSELLRAAEQAQVRTFGWPIGLVLHRDDERPKPRVDGIVARVHETTMGDSYDYWALRRNGDFYSKKSLFEDKRDPEAIFFNTRIIRTTEAVLYALRLYEKLEIDPSSEFMIRIGYEGLKGRTLRSASANRSLSLAPVVEEDSITTEYQGSLQKAESELTTVVKELVAPVFALFDFQVFADSVYESIVTDFLNNKVS